MKVSIITACFNRESTIRGCIDSVLNQDYPDIEYIVVDGASTDGTMKIVNEYKDRIARIISEPDEGMYEGINKGLRIATGDIIGVLHSDDLLFDKDTVSRLVYRFKVDSCDMVYGNGVYVRSSNTNVAVRRWISGQYKRSRVALGWLPLHPTVYVTKDWLAKCGLYDESYKIASDSEWLVRSLYDMHPKVSNLKFSVVRMRMGGISTIPAKSKSKWQEDLRLYRSHHIFPYIALAGKILSKLPQFVLAKFA